MHESRVIYYQPARQKCAIGDSLTPTWRLRMFRKWCRAIPQPFKRVISWRAMADEHRISLHTPGYSVLTRHALRNPLVTRTALERGRKVGRVAKATRWMSRRERGRGRRTIGGAAPVAQGDSGRERWEKFTRARRHDGINRRSDRCKLYDE